ncbi:hypothetical protein G7046_g1437 [Stylonectria norvegica]|nr:hypothetical protein G7046_g1437 [Stylonectria norvegica]
MRSRQPTTAALAGDVVSQISTAVSSLQPPTPPKIEPSSRLRIRVQPLQIPSRLLRPRMTFSGLPTSGKSTRAQQLYEYLSTRLTDSKYRLHLVSDDSLSISRTVYDLSPSKLPAHTRSANASEKDARAAIYGAVKRVLSDKDIVILDGLNYIKGWRYQLHCEAKAVRTPSCILQIGCAVDRAKQVNEERLQHRQNSGTNQVHDQTDTKTDGAEPYEPSNWENLVFRYEEPNPMTRWDSPLFTLIWEDDEQQANKVFSEMWEVIAGEARKAVRPNQATVQRGRDAGGDYLYILDRETQDIVKRILEQQSNDGGDEVKIPTSSGAGDDLIIDLPVGKKLGVPQLQRLRRAFVGLNRGGIGLDTVGNMASDRMRETFVRYLNASFEQDEKLCRLWTAQSCVSSGSMAKAGSQTVGITKHEAQPPLSMKAEIFTARTSKASPFTIQISRPHREAQYVLNEGGLGSKTTPS